MKKIILYISILLATTNLALAQDDAAQNQGKQANNPLANMKAFNIQHYYVPSLSGIDGASAGNTMLRYAQPIGRVLMRATLPIATRSMPEVGSASGLGDINIFATYLLSDPSSANQFGIGPQITLPTGTNHMGNDTWGLGGAMVAFFGANPKIQFGGLITYDHSISDDQSKAVNNKLIIQPFAYLQLGNGSYLRSAPAAIFDLEKGEYNIPLGIGMGKVVRVNKTVYNVFIEPQYSIASKGLYQPTFQLYTCINFQFLK